MVTSMQNHRNFLSGKQMYLFGLLLLSFISIIYAAFGMTEGDDFFTARREVLFRKIGHELLLQSGDSTSRVLPVKREAENEYQISFEKEFTFRPDSLMNTTRRVMAKDPLVQDYVVNVLNSANSSVVYGFAISKNKKEDIVSCGKRMQPRAGYLINFKFNAPGQNTARNRYLLGSLPFLAVIGFIFLRTVKPRKALPEKVEDMDRITLGAILFDVKAHKLTINGQTIDLTGTETRLLRIFALSPNETIARSRLQKEIWEDEGVIVGRSLDMFISKLRKKIEFDPQINIVVQRGKGYRLEISGGKD